MAKYFAGTRSLMSLRSLGSVTWTTTAGRFDPLYVPGAVLVGGENARVDVPIGLDAASVTTLWGHFESFTADVGFFNTDNYSFLQFINPSGTTIARFEMGVSPEALRFQFWNGSTFVRAGPVVFPSIGIRDVFDFRIVCGTTGSFQLWRNGSIALSVTGLSAAVDRIAAVGLGSFPRDALAYSQVALSDFDMRAWKFPSDILTTAGTYNEGTGTLGNMVDLDLNTSFRSRCA
ncbi:MAG: hypothetical protein DDT25_00107 [Chloroflexi bacterium]|nr:hypothetical protein [Chloroflexota bacterium]